MREAAAWHYEGTWSEREDNVKSVLVYTVGVRSRLPREAYHSLLRLIAGAVRARGEIRIHSVGYVPASSSSWPSVRERLEVRAYKHEPSKR